MAIHESAHADEEIVAEGEGILAQAIALKDFQHLETDRAGDGIAAEGVEIFHAVVEAVGNLARGDQGRHRVAVADGLAHGDEVRHRPFRLERPHMRADAAEADLHLVGDHQRTCRAGGGIGGGEITFRQHDLPRRTRQRFGDEGGGRVSGPRKLCRGFPDRFRITFADLGLRPVGGRAIGIGQHGLAGGGGPALAALALVLVGAHLLQRHEMAVIGPVERHDTLTLCVVARHAERQIVRLAAAAHEGGDGQVLGQGCRQRLGIGDDVVVEIAGIGVEQGGLFRQYRDDLRVGVAEMGDVVVTIEIGAAAIVIKIDTLAAHDLHRRLVGDGEVADQLLLAPREQIVARATALLQRLRRQAGEGRSIGEKFRPEIEIAFLAGPDHIGRRGWAIGDELQMHMGLPAAILAVLAELADDGASLQKVADLHGLRARGAEMAPERIEDEARLRLMFQQDGMAVIQRQIGYIDVDHARRQRCPHIGAGGEEKIESEMQRAALASRQGRRKGVGGIDRPVLAPGADSKFDFLLCRVRVPDGFGLVRLPPGRGNGDGMLRVAERHQALGIARDRLVQNGGQAAAIFVEPVAYRLRARHRFEAAGATQDCGGEDRVHRAQAAEQIPGRRFADREIGIVAGAVAPCCRHGDADDEAERHQIVEKIDLFGEQRVDAVECRCHCCRILDRRRPVHDGIGRGDGEFVDERGMDRIAEIDEAGHLLPGVAIDQDVVVVGIAMDHLGAAAF